MPFGCPARIVLVCLYAALGATPLLAQTPIGEVHSADATVKGSVMVSVASTRLMSGSSVSAGASNASVRLMRSGELRVCAGTSVSLTSSPSGNELMVSMSSGAVEMHYPLPGSRDSLMTPDFEISLIGPGLLHLAISTDARGNTCVQSLHGNTGKVTVSELMGTGSYTLKPDEQVIFRAGQATNPGEVMGNCGCPPPMPVQRAAAEPPLPPVTNAMASPPPPVAALIASSPAPSTSKETAPPPSDHPGQVHVQVEAPFVFRATDLPRPPTTPDLVRMRLSDLPTFPTPYAEGPPAPAPQPAEMAQTKPKNKRHGFWGFLASIFKG